MEKEYIGVNGRVRLEADNQLFVKSSIRKENLHLAHLEWINLEDVNFQGRGTLNIITDDDFPFDIVFKKEQYNQMKQLSEFLLPYTRRLIIDEENNSITILNKGNLDTKVRPMNKINVSPPYTDLSFSDINNFEIICDKQIINNDILKNAAAGTYVADGIGGLFGVLSSLDHGEFISNLQIKLNTNDINNPCVYLNYITSKIKSNSKMAKDLIKMCDQDYAKLLIISKKDNNPSSQQSPSNNQFEAVKKLKELLDMGILTQEEFDKKKKEVLNL